LDSGRRRKALQLNHIDHIGHSDQRERIMIIETSAVSFRQNLGDMLNQVHYHGDSIVINQDDKSIAALIDARLFERIRREQARFDSLSQRLAQGFAATPQDAGMAEIDAAVQGERPRTTSSKPASKPAAKVK
jgi:PHD/YefM family antitoxin component YafN of YafNO toxin-antitoxin module